MMKHSKWLGVALGCAALMLAAQAVPADDASSEKVTFTKDILPILQQNCQQCHRQTKAAVGGMVAPMSLMSYEEARPWAKSMAKAVQERKMPPWSATDAFHGVFENERYISPEEREKIAKWAQTGAPMGDPKDAPAPVSFPDSQWWVGEPDVVVQLPKPVWVGDDVEDWQPMIQVPLDDIVLPEDRWLRGMECVAGSKVVHHIVVYAFGPGMERDPGPAGVGGNLGGLAPGAEPEMARDGYGILLKKGTTLAVSMHYHKETGPGTGAWDQSKIGLHFYPKDAKIQNTQIAPIGNLAFEIPPNNASWQVGMAHTLDRPVTLLSMLPHMHFRGAAARYEAFYPDGRKELLLQVDDYDYAWQHSYRFKEPKQLPIGTRIEVKMWFDNSSENAANPDPAKAVRFGGPTTDEMALGWMYYSFDDEEPTEAGKAESGPKVASVN